MGAYKQCLLVEWSLPARVQVSACTRIGTTGHTVSSLIKVDFPAPLGPNNILSTGALMALSKRTNNPNTAAEAECAADICKTRLVPPGISESAVGHLQNGPGVASHPHQAARLREGELDRGRGKRIVTLGLGFFLNKGR